MRKQRFEVIVTAGKVATWYTVRDTVTGRIFGRTDTFRDRGTSARELANIQCAALNRAAEVTD